MSEYDRVSFLYRNTTVKIECPRTTGNVGRQLRNGRFYEQKFLEYIAGLELDGVYVDVGANIGNHSVYFAKFTNAEKVLAIEANPAILPVLETNIKNNNLEKKVFIHDVAAGDKEGVVGLQINPNDEIGGAKIIVGKEIKMKRLDKFINMPISLIKIDVEGSEMGVLRGARELLKKQKPELMVEAVERSHFIEIANYLKRYGYVDVATYNNSATHHFSATKKPQKLHSLTRLYPVRRLIRHS